MVRKSLYSVRRWVGQRGPWESTDGAKTKRILENRLDKALVKFNEALAHNKNLREKLTT